MTTFFAKRVGHFLVPVGEESMTAFEKMPPGKEIRVECKQPRNLQHHKLYWALCARIAGGVDIDPENVSDLFKIATGHCVTLRSKLHGVVQVPRSISFASMDQTAFAEFFERCVRVAYEEWGIEPAAVADLLAPQVRAA